MQRPPGTTPFPYTTLFRSQDQPTSDRVGDSSQRSSVVAPSSPERSVATTSVASWSPRRASRSEEHTSELQSRRDLVCRLLLEKKNGEAGSSNDTVGERGSS